jgi:uncharacterized protein
MPNRSIGSLSLITWFVALLLAVSSVPVRAAFPTPQGRVNDFAGVLDAPTRAQLQQVVDDVEQATTAEVAVVTVASLDGMDIERYADGLFRTWGIGKKGVDNGVLVLVCPAERKMRIEVGYGLEGVLPDGLTGAVIRQQFTPAFREGDYARGVLDGVTRLAAIVRANHVLTPEELRALEQEDSAGPPGWLMTPFFGLFIALGATALGVGMRTRSVFARIWGGLFGGIPAVMALIPFFNASLWVLVPLAIGLFLLGYFKGAAWMAKLSDVGPTSGEFSSADDAGSGTRRREGGRDSASSSSRSSRSTSSSSSSNSSWSSSSRSSSGGSFGGGRSGGGGASGSW